MYAKTLPPDHLNVGIAGIRLGRVLERQSRDIEAAKESQAGYDILEKQSEPPAPWLQQARTNLIEEYQRLNRPQKVAELRAQFAETKQSTREPANPSDEDADGICDTVLSISAPDRLASFPPKRGVAGCGTCSRALGTVEFSSDSEAQQ